MPQSGLIRARSARSFVGRVARLLAIACVAAAAPAGAAQIDLKLDVTYAGGLPSAGGTWKLFAKTDEEGLFSLRVRLSDVNGAITNELPQGTVNGSDPAGFSTFFTNPVSGDRELFATQQVLNQSSPQQGVFYGVGTLSNGAPNYPGAPGGTNQLGPNMTSLTAVGGVPWATEDPLWATGVTVASGTFSPGDSPTFGASATSPMGDLLTTIGTNSTPGLRTGEVAFTSVVLDNLSFGVATGDYNGNGVVDAADYTVWRDNAGKLVPALTSADGNGDGVVDDADYQLWTANYGRTDPSPAAAVPEPTSGLLAGFAAVLGWLRGGRAAVSPVFEEKSGHLTSLA